MTVKELKNILNSRTELDNCEVQINFVANGGGYCVPLESVESMLRFYDSYDGTVVYLVGCLDDESKETRDKDPLYEEVEIENYDDDE